MDQASDPSVMDSEVAFQGLYQLVEVSLDPETTACSAKRIALGGVSAEEDVPLETVGPAEVVAWNEAAVAEAVGTVIAAEVFEVAMVVTVVGS